MPFLLAEGIYNKLEELKKSFPNDIEYSVPFESVTVVKVSMHEVVITLLEALGLVAIVVFLFLQNWRATLIPVLAIPVSIVGTFIFFIPLGFTINTLTMFGFVLAIGIVVDDAIIVVEAVQHYMDSQGMSAKDAHAPRHARHFRPRCGYCPHIGVCVRPGRVYTPVSWGGFTSSLP